MPRTKTQPQQRQKPCKSRIRQRRPTVTFLRTDAKPSCQPQTSNQRVRNTADPKISDRQATIKQGKHKPRRKRRSKGPAVEVVEVKIARRHANVSLGTRVPPPSAPNPNLLYGVVDVTYTHNSLFSAGLPIFDRGVRDLELPLGRDLVYAAKAHKPKTAITAIQYSTQ